MIRACRKAVGAAAAIDELKRQDSVTTPTYVNVGAKLSWCFMNVGPGRLPMTENRQEREEYCETPAGNADVSWNYGWPPAQPRTGHEHTVVETATVFNRQKASIRSCRRRQALENRCLFSCSCPQQLLPESL